MRDSNRGLTGDSSHFSIPTMHGFDEYFATEAKVPTFNPMIKPVEFDTLNGESLRFGIVEMLDLPYPESTEVDGAPLTELLAAGPTNCMIW